MRNRLSAITAALLLLVTTGFTQQRAGEPVSVYSGGLTIGSVKALNEDLQEDVSEAFIKLGYTSQWTLSDRSAIFWDLDWYGPGVNFGTAIGANFKFIEGKVSPYVGVGAGGVYFDHDEDFSNGFGPALKAQIGLQMDLTQTFGMRIQMPYQFVANSKNDHTLGLEFTFCWYGKFKNIKTI